MKRDNCTSCIYLHVVDEDMICLAMNIRVSFVTEHYCADNYTPFTRLVSTKEERE
jgi:hypothetical protein